MVKMPDLLSSNSISNLGSSLTGTVSNLGSSLTGSASNLTSSFSNPFASSSSDMNSGNRLQSANETITEVRSGLNEQNQKLNNLQTTLQSVSQNVNSNSNTRDQLEGTNTASEDNTSNYILYEQQRSNVGNLDGIKSPESLEKLNYEIKSQFVSKVEELKQKFIQYKLNEDDTAFERLYERCGHELDAIKQKRSDLDDDIKRMNNILNLRLSNMDNEINKNLRITNTLRSKIQKEEDEDNSFLQMKKDEVREYRLNIVYMIGVILGSGILFKNIMDYTPKK